MLMLASLGYKSSFTENWNGWTARSGSACARSSCGRYPGPKSSGGKPDSAIHGPSAVALTGNLPGTDSPGVDLPGIDLPGIDSPTVNLASTDLPRADLPFARSWMPGVSS